MKNFNKIDEMVIPYYEQFKELGELREDECIDYKFLNNARGFFSKQYFFELRLIVKAENRLIKREFRQAKKIEQQQITQQRKAEKQLKKQKNQAKQKKPVKQKINKELKVVKQLKKPHAV